MSNPSQGQVENSTDFSLAPGEAGVYGDRFLASVLAPYLKAQMMCSTTRFVYKCPNTLLGFIPLGYQESTVPIRNIASVSTNSKFMLGRAIFALLILILSFTAFSSGGGAVIVGLLLLAWAAGLALTAFPVALVVANPAGGATTLIVSSLEKKKLEVFRTELQNRVFADSSQIHHDEAQQLRMQQVMLQQMHLQQNMVQQQQQQQYQQPQVMPQQYDQSRALPQQQQYQGYQQPAPGAPQQYAADPQMQPQQYAANPQMQPQQYAADPQMQPQQYNQYGYDQQSQQQMPPSSPTPPNPPSPEHNG